MTIDEMRKIAAEHGIVVSIRDTVRLSDVAKLLGCSVRTVQRMRRDGLLPAPVRIGRSKRYPLCDLADALSRFVARRDDEALPARASHVQAHARPAEPCSLRRR